MDSHVVVTAFHVLICVDVSDLPRLYFYPISVVDLNVLRRSVSLRLLCTLDRIVSSSDPPSSTSLIPRPLPQVSSSVNTPHVGYTTNVCEIDIPFTVEVSMTLLIHSNTLI